MDTSVIIEFARGHGERLKKFLQQQEQGKLQLVVPSVVIFEFYSGLSLKKPDIQDKSDLLFSKFKVADVNEEIAKIAARLNRENELYKQVGAVDLLVAATTFYLSADLATENKKDFKPIPDLKLAY